MIKASAPVFSVLNEFRPEIYQKIYYLIKASLVRVTTIARKPVCRPRGYKIKKSQL